MKSIHLNIVNIIICLVIFSSTCRSQKVVKSTLSFGGVSKTFETGHYVSSSLGQNALVGSVDLKKHSVYQGFQGPIVSVRKINVEFTVFPNSFEDYLEIRWKKDINSFVNVNIYNIAGGLLMERKYFVENKELLIENLNFSSGSYILILKVNEINSKGIKIIKK